jgi:hypothetical protein
MNLNKQKRIDINCKWWYINFKKSDELYCEGTSGDICSVIYKNKRKYISLGYLHYFTLKPIIEVREDKLKLIGIIWKANMYLT